MSDAPPPAESPPPNGDAAPPAAGPPPAGVRPAAPSRKAARPWQGGRFRATDRRSKGGRLRAILIVLAVMLALAGAVVAWLLYLGSVPRPYFTAIAIDQYDPPIPPNQWTAQDREALRGRGWPESNAFTSQQRDRLVAELSNLGRNQPADQPLVIYLRAYALPLADGKLAVLPGGANLDDENAWLPLEDVFGFIKECPVRRKLVLLDVAQPFADARAGAVADDAASRAEPVVKKAVESDAGLLVLCACSPGQTSLASEEMGHTVFVHYVMEGLAGAADGATGAGPDNRVSVRELAAFTAANVDRWAAHNRGARQTPVLFPPDGLDFALAVDQSGPPPAVDAKLDAKYPDWLNDAWALRDRWEADLRAPTPAALYRELERDARRAEAQWRGGAQPPGLQTALQGQAGTLDADPRRRRAAGAAVRDSLALALVEGRKPPGRDKVDNAVFQLRQMADLLPPPPPKTGPAPPPDPALAAQLEARKKAFLTGYDGKPFDLAYVVFQAAKDPQHPDPTPEALRLWLSLLRPEMGKPADYEELHILELVSGLDVKDPQKEWMGVVGLAVDQAEAAAQAHAELDLCPAGPLTDRLREWAQKSDGLRQTAEDALLNASPADRLKAAQKLDPAQAGGRSYESIRQAARTLRTALRCREDALTLLPDYVAYLEHDRARETEWTQAVEQTRILRDVLAKPPAEGPPPEWFQETEAQTRSLRANLNNLLQPVNSRLAALNPPNPKAGAADAEDMRAMLRLPALSAKDRVALWEAWRNLAGRLNDDALSAELPPPDAEKANKEERELALLRARTSLALLKLDGADATQAQAALDSAAQHPSDEKALPKLGRELRAAWKRLDEQHGH